ncbi:MAG: hypothetical protein ACOX41_02725 [Anaerovoracaceae bacterium]|jgi:hypothetical protein
MMLLLFITPMMVQAKNGSSYCLWISASPDPTSMPESRYRLATQDVNAVNHGESDVAEFFSELSKCYSKEKEKICRRQRNLDYFKELWHYSVNKPL